ncbi:hypothetical protein [Calothrix sp. NIES-3974]|nr:hypothetical protein [Calothrix sp. NIES-3974]
MAKYPVIAIANPALFFQIPFTQKIIINNNVKIIVYDPEDEVIVKWQK